MMKYPYSFEDFRKETIKQFKTEYANVYKNIEKEEMEEIIKKGFEGNKFQHENNITPAMDKISKEVQGVVYCLSMF